MTSSVPLSQQPVRPLPFRARGYKGMCFSTRTYLGLAKLSRWGYKGMCFSRRTILGLARLLYRGYIPRVARLVGLSDTAHDDNKMRQ